MMEDFSRRIAQIRADRLEKAEGFLPEELSREVLAPCFGLSPEQISDAELTEIQEFAINAGLEMAANRSPENSVGNFIPFHDIFHAAERMRVSKGENATPDFITRDNIGRYMHPEVIRQEFYPPLFLPSTIEGMNLSQLVCNFTDNESIIKGIPYERKSAFEYIDFTRLTPQQRYETIIRAIIEDNGSEKLSNLERTDLMTQFLRNLERVFDSSERPAHYTEFAERVFSGEWQDNPRLFLDQFLSDIRTIS